MAAVERTLALLAQAIAALEAVTPVPTGALTDDGAWDETDSTASNRQSA
jgi:hypothetical protein